MVKVRAEDDGDHHVNVLPDPAYGGFLNSGDRNDQNGALVTEIMKGQSLPLPFVGEHISVFGTWVLDEDHGWNEIHPIWAIKYLDTGDLAYKLPPATPKYNPDEGGGGGGDGNCTPGYSPCLPPESDYDCYGGGGNGPYYTAPGVVYKVTGSDPYGLDADGDGLGCE